MTFVPIPMSKPPTLKYSALKFESAATASLFLGSSSANVSGNANPDLPGAPRLLGSASVDPTHYVGASGGTVELSFSETVLAGSGFIYVTDGVAQTVIDRATGKPTMRIVGATHTEVIDVNDAAKVSIVGGAVTLHTGTLKADRSYKVLMAKGVFEDTAGNDFAGISAGGTVSFHTNTAPSASIALSKNVLGAGASMQVTVTFSEAVRSLDPADVGVSHGTLGAFTANAARTVWTATLTQTGALDGVDNAISLAGDAFRDVAGNVGSGVATSSYVVDIVAPSIVETSALTGMRTDAAVSITFSEAVYWEDEAPLTLTLDGESIAIERSAVEFSNAHKTMTIPAAALALASGRAYTLHLPASLGDVAGNAPDQTVLVLETAVVAPTAQVDGTIGIIDNGRSATDNLTSEYQQLFSGTYAGELAADDFIQLRINERVVTATVDQANHSWSYAGQLADGIQNVSAFVTNGSYDSAAITRTFRIDQSAPVAAGGAFHGNIASNQDFTLAFNEALYWQGTDMLTFEGNGQTLSFSRQELGFVDGSQVLSIRADLHKMMDGFTYALSLPGSLTDAAGNHPQSVHTLDTSDGGSSVVTPPAQLGAPDLHAFSDTGRSWGDNLTADRTPTFWGAGAEAHAIVGLFEGGVRIASGTANDKGVWWITSPTLASGSHTVSVIQYDAFGNASTASPGLTVVLDNQGPAAVSDSVVGHTLAVKFDENVAFTGGKFYIRDKAGHLVKTITPSDVRSWDIDNSDRTVLTLWDDKLKKGLHTVYFSSGSLQDDAGNFAAELVGDNGISWLVA